MSTQISQNDWKSVLSMSVGLTGLICAFLAATPASATAQISGFPNTSEVQSTTHTLQKRAAPDECFAYLASPSPVPKFSDPTDCGRYGTNPPAKPKVNQSYIWGLTQSGDHLWFGTFANGNCVTQAGVSTPMPGYQTDTWVCEFEYSPYYPSPFPSPLIADARPPRIYKYSKTTKVLVDMTPRYSIYVNPNNIEGIVPLLGSTRGLRSATTHNGVILLAGPNLDPRAGIAFFAYDEATGEYLGHRVLLGHNNIRQFVSVDGILYTAVGKNFCSGFTCTPEVTGGAVLRLDVSRVPGCTFVPPPPGTLGQACFLLNGGTPQAPTPPTEVGTLNTTGGSLAAHNGRIYTVTWPAGSSLPGVVSSLYMSPVVPPGGLTAQHASQWTQVWKASDYEPDPGIVQTYAGGAIASFDGYLFWGTLHIPMTAFQILANAYPPATGKELVQALSGTMRAAVLFRGKDLETTDRKIDLLYGNEKLPVFTPPNGSTPATWTMVPNKMGQKSLWGPSGFGNLWNTYMWSARVWNNRLWIGTMDWGFQARQGMTATTPVKLSFPEQFTNVPNKVGGLDGSIPAVFPEEMFVNAAFGGDVFYFTSATKPAFPESTNGLGNPTTYGVRNQLVSSGTGSLFLGSANPMNLLTQPEDQQKFGGLGGWELNELSPLPDNTPAGPNVTVSLPNGVSITYCTVTTAGRTFSSIVKNPFDAGLKVDPLLSGFNLEGPLLPSGIARTPSSLVMLWSSALWGQGCASPSPAKVKLPIPPGLTAPRLLEMRWDGNRSRWHDVTTQVNTQSGTIEADISSQYLGVLPVAQATEPSLRARVEKEGIDANGAYFVDLRVTNVGTGTAESVSLNSLTFKTLAGEGTVSYNTALSPPLPRSVGSIDPGGSAVVRMYLRSSTSFGVGGVRAFEIVEALSMLDVLGRSFNQNLSQSLLPTTAPPPSITGINPKFGLRGSPTIDATITGVNLSGATLVRFSGSGVSVSIREGGTDTTLPISISISVSAPSGSRTLTVSTTNGSGSLANAFTVDTPKDLNGDGNSDLLFRSTQTGDVSGWLMNGLAVKQWGGISGLSAQLQIVGKGDLDWDGKTDLVLRNTQTGDVSGWLMNGLTIKQSGLIYSGLSSKWQIAEVADLDGDGRADLIFRNTDTGDVSGWLMNGLALKSANVIFPALSLKWKIAGAGDLNADGKADLIFRNTDTGDVSGWLMNGLALGSTSIIYAAVPSVWQIVAVGDLDADGKADLVWRSSGTGDVSGWLMNGLTPKQLGVITPAVSSLLRIDDIGDLDADGKADLVFRNTQTGDVSGWLMNGLAVKQSGVIYAGLSAVWQIE